LILSIFFWLIFLFNQQLLPFKKVAALQQVKQESISILTPLTIFMIEGRLKKSLTKPK
jgi:hypothetical protein